ncbi:hypothetical protein, conserved [Leishmania tarentolae]|uniref:Uncharacterized protein n=1 Tax=Leishmania tarentolae TaxID=5689 RepID=A0A640KKB0_LEITA|nr:hypothetical protein, conserved [Leishmania tarentolae]
MLDDSLAKPEHAPSSSPSSLASSCVSVIQHESAASVVPCSSSSSSASTASVTAHGSPVSKYALTTDTTALEGAPLSLSHFEKRTRALEEERLHSLQLAQRAANAFEEHRRELTQLMQKERAIRGHREDVLRAQLQETLQANRELMARVAEQRRRHEVTWTAELQGHRSSNTGPDEFELTLRQLYEEWAELRRGVAETEISHEEHRRSLAACLRDQECLISRVRSLEDGLRDAEAAAAVAEVHQQTVDDGRGQAKPAAAPVKRAKEGWAEKTSSRTSVEALPRHMQHPRCSYCDMPPKVCDAPSPTRRVPRRHFVPSGPWDACSPCRASSPCTHNVEAMVATIERGNYLRPRLYHHRVGRGPANMAGVSVAAASPYRHRHSGASTTRPLRPPPAVCAVSLCASTTPPRNGENRRLSNCQHSPGLSSSSTSCSTSTPDTHTEAGSSPSSCSCSACEFAPTSYTLKGSTDLPSSRHRNERRREVSPYTPRNRCLSPRNRGEGRRAGTQVCAGVRMSPRHGEATTALGSFQVFPRAALPLSPPTADGLHGSALNATCRALLTDLADMRTEYRLYQRQLRHPHGDSVAASQAMRRLMHEMDNKADQIRALRLEQGRHNDALRVRDVLREIAAENRYCEAVYSDLLDLIHT